MLNLPLGESVKVRATGTFHNMGLGDWLNVVILGTVAPAGDITLTLNQAADAAGTGAVALTSAPNCSAIAENIATGVRTAIAVTVSDVGVITIANADVPANHAVVVSVRGDQINLNVGKPYLRAVVAGQNVGDVVIDLQHGLRSRP
jgi:hypothetical protein